MTIDTSPTLKPPTQRIDIAIKGFMPRSSVKLSYNPTAHVPLLIKNDLSCPTVVVFFFANKGM